MRASAAYYMTTGLWPLMHLGSFEAVTGKKTDRWLVRMVGLLALSNGIALAVGARSRHASPEVAALFVATAMSFATIDIVYVLRGTIRPIYLLDACLEVGLIVALATAEDC
jgi:hypothetical protein